MKRETYCEILNTAFLFRDSKVRFKPVENILYSILAYSTDPMVSPSVTLNDTAEKIIEEETGKILPNAKINYNNTRDIISLWIDSNKSALED